MRDVLGPARLAAARAGLERLVPRVVAHDATRAGNRGSHRYSLTAGGIRALGAQRAWVAGKNRYGVQSGHVNPLDLFRPLGHIPMRFHTVYVEYSVF